jgi:hypothetical protein
MSDQQQPERDHIEDRPVILNPEAVGDPDQTPIVQLPPSMAAYFERTRCPVCELINHCHEEGCPHA